MSARTYTFDRRLASSCSLPCIEIFKDSIQPSLLDSNGSACRSIATVANSRHQIRHKSLTAGKMRQPPSASSGWTGSTPALRKHHFKARRAGNYCATPALTVAHLATLSTPTAMTLITHLQVLLEGGGLLRIEIQQLVCVLHGRCKGLVGCQDVRKGLHRMFAASAPGEPPVELQASVATAICCTRGGPLTHRQRAPCSQCVKQAPSLRRCMHGQHACERCPLTRRSAASLAHWKLRRKFLVVLSSHTGTCTRPAG